MPPGAPGALPVLPKCCRTGRVLAASRRQALDYHLSRGRGQGRLRRCEGVYCGPLNVENIKIAKTRVAGSPRSGPRRATTNNKNSDRRTGPHDAIPCNFHDEQTKVPNNSAHRTERDRAAPPRQEARKVKTQVVSLRSPTEHATRNTNSSHVSAQGAPGISPHSAPPGVCS